MRVIGKSWGWLWEEKHFDSTLGSTSTVIWTLPLTDSKTNIVLCLVGCTCTMTSSRDTAVRPGKLLIVVKENLPSCAFQDRLFLGENCLRLYILSKVFHKNDFYFLSNKEKKKLVLLNYWIYCSCYSNNIHTTMRLSVHAIAYSGHQRTDKCQ